MGWLFGLGGRGASSARNAMSRNSNMYNNLLTTLAPHMKLLSDIGGTQTAGANKNFADAEGVLTEVLNYYKNILGGDRENLLKTLDASAVTKAYDEQARQNYELAPRGGRRAATAANLEMSKMAELNKLLQYLRGTAPGQMANIGQAFASMGNSRQAQAIQSLLGVTGLRFNIEAAQNQNIENQNQRNAEMIAGIMEMLGGIAGAAAGGR